MTTSSKTNKEMEKIKMSKSLKTEVKVMNDLEQYFYNCRILRMKPSIVTFHDKLEPLLDIYSIQAKEAGRKEEILEILDEIEGRMPYGTKRHYKIIEDKND
jgi:hypothetical protein